MGIKDVNLEDGNKLPVRELKLHEMAEHAAIVMIARRGSGKSWICRALLKAYSDYPVGLIIAPTDRMNAFYGTFFPDTYIHYEYKIQILEKLLKRQEKLIDKLVEKKKVGKKFDSRCYVVMDDCLASSKTWMKDLPIRELLMNGRHYHLMYILTMQAPLGITPEMRMQFEYIFLLAEDFISNLKKMYDHYAGMFPTFESFRQVFSKLTEDHGCMVIMNTNRHKKKVETTGTFLDKIRWYKADNIEISDIGCKQFQKYHSENFDPNWRRKHNSFNLNDFCIQNKKEKKGLTIQKIV